MSEDRNPILTAAGHAQRAASFLMGFAHDDPGDDPEFGPTRPVEGPAEGDPKGASPT
jgi:hypothetical protein